MEQERQKREAEETEFQTPNMPILCANNCGFFGSSATNNLCSKCYKDAFLTKSKAVLESVVAPPVADVPKVEETPKVDAFVEQGNPSSAVAEEVAASPVKKPSNRCNSCNKKVGLMGFKCRCGDVFCSLHRYSDKHGCPFDYRGEGQEAIAKANPVVKADKVDKI